MWSKGRARRLIVGFMGGAALVSSFMSDIPTCVIFGMLALQLLEVTGEACPGESRLGRALMIAVPVGAILGGFSTPAGNGINILVMAAVESVAGVQLTFAQWSIAGIPVAIAMVGICSWWLYRCVKPDDIGQDVVNGLVGELTQDARFDSYDAKFLFILGVMVVFWVSSSWITEINIAVVSIVGVIVMHLPGIELLKGKDFVEGVSWEAFLMCGGIVALGAGVQSTGAIAWIVQTLLSGIAGWPTVAVLLVFSIIPCVVHMVTPAAGAIYALTVIPLVTAAVMMGLDPRAVALIVGVWVCIVFVQPLDLVYLLTYGNGYYTMDQLVRFGILPTLILLAISVLWIPAICAVF